MRAAGIERYGDGVHLMNFPEPRPLEVDEILLQVRAVGVGNWDNIVRTGGWDLGITPPMVLGTEAAGSVLAVGSSVRGASAGDAVITHPVPLRQQGAWAERVIVAESTIAPKPAWMPWQEAGALPVPALTAYQALGPALHVEPGEWVLVHGAGGVTGGLLVTVAAELGARVIATARPGAKQRVLDAGATQVVDNGDSGWTDAIRELTGRQGVAAAVNALRGEASLAMRAVRSGGRLATITGDPPPERDGIAVSNVYVRADGEQLRTVTALLERRHTRVHVGGVYPLEQAAEALSVVVEGSSRGAAILDLRGG
jgi:NADPH:quinone reductase-like Zn-dependent oxidoreductase